MILFEVTNNLDFKTYFKRAGVSPKGSSGADLKAKIFIARLFMLYMILGSPNNSVIPPEDTAALKASASVFVGDKLVMISPLSGEGTNPNTSYSAPMSQITAGFNMPYSAFMHENLSPAGGLNPGITSVSVGNAQGKWIESHLASDGPLLMAAYAKKFKKETGG